MDSSHSSYRRNTIRRLLDIVAEPAAEERLSLLVKTFNKNEHTLQKDVEYLLQTKQITDPRELLSQTKLIVERQADFFKGQSINHYRILEKIGGGGMGIVFKAYDTKLDRLVALKFLPWYLSNDEQAKIRFTNEAKAASALEHPNICTIHEINETDDNRLFIVMAYYDGESLKKKIERGPVPVDKAVQYTLEIARGLKKAHRAGIIHRDIKPANIMITDNGLVKIVDFGLAKIQEVHITKSQTTLGTVAYMSPEQAMGGEIDQRTDIWSLGVTLYEMLIGQRPFNGEYEQAVIFEIINSNPVSALESNSLLSRKLVHVIERMLRKDPDERYRQIDELLHDFNQDEISPSNLTKSPTFIRRQLTKLNGRSHLSVITGVLVILIAFLTFTFFRTSQIRFSERDWILITDFKNETSEEIFNHSLKTALTASISQSRHSNVVSNKRIQQVLQRMRRSDIKFIDAELGSEIAQREGIPVVLIPSISRVGNSYAISSILQDSKSGEILKSEIVRAQAKDNVLDALDKMSKKIRQDLGEALTDITNHSKPLQQVTTSSLDALQQYSLGLDLLIKASFKEARIHFERALEIDSTFTTARASLGILHLERSSDAWAEGFNADTGKVLLSEAVQQVDSLTDSEKYNILAFHSWKIEDNLVKAASHYRTLLELYPDRFVTNNNLGRVYEAMQKYELAEKHFKKAIRLNPYSIITFNNLNGLYLWKTGRLDSAWVWARNHVKHNPDYFFSHSLLGYTYLGLDSLDMAQQHLEKALTLEPNSGRDLFRLSRVHWLNGDLDQALEPLEKIQNFNPGTWAEYWQAILFNQFERIEEARKKFNRFSEIAQFWIENYPNYGNSYIAKGLVLTHTGEPERGWEIAQKAFKVDNSPEIYMGMARIACVQGNHSKALELLKEAINKGYSDFIWMKIHPDLEPLHGRYEFQQLLDQKLKI